MLISICELHNDLISEGNIYQSKEEIDDKTGNPLINDTSLRVLMPKNAQKWQTGTNRCVAEKYVLLFAT